MYMYVQICTNMYICVCIHVHTCVYIYRERDDHVISYHSISDQIRSYHVTGVPPTQPKGGGRGLLRTTMVITIVIVISMVMIIVLLCYCAIVLLLI